MHILNNFWLSSIIIHNTERMKINILYILHIAQLNEYDRLDSSLLFHSVTSEPYKRYGLHLVLTRYCNSLQVYWNYVSFHAKSWSTEKIQHAFDVYWSWNVLPNADTTTYHPRYLKLTHKHILYRGTTNRNITTTDIHTPHVPNSYHLVFTSIKCQRVVIARVSPEYFTS